ncbi:ABC transporter permease [Aestuariimicrobium ganziense]|uniref:ABC transporter permease n=1 Tax=Aestuariimicrobium ganziense TaxID=2773677 RepID=UPI0019414937|nr:hypothetical protein [Aestuariimicrobium ganziense]
MTGWTTMLRHLVRTSWLGVLAAPTLLAALVIGTFAGVKHLYPTAVERQIYAATLGESPASWAFNGRGYDLEALGGIGAYEVGFMGQLALPVVGLLLSVRTTRALEDSGHLELITSARVARTAIPVASLATSLMVWTLFAVLVHGGLVVLGLPVSGAAGYAGTMALFGLAASGLGLVLGQLAGSARSATSLGLTLVMGGYLVRAVVDGRKLDAAWLSPMGWAAEARPWGPWHWWPVVAHAALAVACGLTALTVAARRDLGQGILPQRPGRATGSGTLAHPMGLAWRITRGGIAGWTIGAIAWAAALGSLSREFVDIVAKNPTLLEALGGNADQLVQVMAMLLTAAMAMAAGVGVVTRLGGEEGEGRLGLLLAGRRSRVGWWLGWCLVAVAATTGVLAAGALALGVTQWIVLDQSTTMDDALRAGLELLPACLAVVGLAATVTALAPRWRALSWLPVAWVTVVGLLGEPLRLPRWAINLSPTELVGRVPVESGDAGATIVLSLAAALLVGVGGWVLARRDLVHG